MLAESDEQKKDYDLTCWYLNQRRITELVGPQYLSQVNVRAGLDAHSTRIAVLAAAKDALTNWLQTYKPPTLGVLLLSGKASSGTLFTHYSDFYCTGLAQHPRRHREKRQSPTIYCHLKGLGHGTTLRLPYHIEHLTGASSNEWLSGHRQLFVLAAISEEREGVIEAIPYVIATPLPRLGDGSSKGIRWGNRLEVYVTEIDSFSLARHEPIPPSSDLRFLRDIPEEHVKRAFAEIIGEPTIPTDWGGERSDLYTTQVVLDARRISTAFAFKGPAKFRPMTMAHLGKNGDQIDRLFSEPADLVILQHCHTITSSVRATMRAYASRVGELRLFALIDGYETLRVLRAYQKCYLTPTARRDTPTKETPTTRDVLEDEL